MTLRTLPISAAGHFALLGVLISISLAAGLSKSPAFTYAQTPPLNLKDPVLISEGDKVFATNCSVAYCHGKEGTAGRAPAVRDRRWEVTQLQKIIREGIPKTSMPNWDDKLSERQILAVVAYILSISGEGESKGPTAAAPPAAMPKVSISGSPDPPTTLPDSLIGNPARGEELFFDSSAGRGCAGCHSIDSKGNSVGPDLTGSARKSARNLFRDIVFPSAHVDSAQQAIRITMKDGERILGLKREETTTAIRVFDMESIPPVLRRLAKDQIVAVEPQSQSAMPERYGEIYSLRQLLDIISFMKSSGAASPVKVTFLDIQ